MAKRLLRGTQLTLPINPPAESEFSESESKPLSAVLGEETQLNIEEGEPETSSTPTADSGNAPSPKTDPPDEIKVVARLWRKCIQLNNQIYFEGKGGLAKLNKQINIYCDRIQEICQEFDIHSWDAIPQAEKWIASLFSCPECGLTFLRDMGCSCGYVPFEPCNSAEVSFHEELKSSAEVGFHARTESIS